MSGTEQPENNLHSLLLIGIQGEEAHGILERKMNEQVHKCVHILYGWLSENSVCGYWALGNGLIPVLGIGTRNGK